MQQRNAGEVTKRPSLLPAPAARTTQRRRTAQTYCYLLDADADLADEFDLRMRVVARQVATAEVVEIDPGPCELWAILGRSADGPGLLILEGVMTADVRVIDRTATELVGAGDLLQPSIGIDDAMVVPDTSWHALLPTRLAVLDGAFAERVPPWPQIGHALLRRA